ncbi:MAG: hypothetical protein U9R42_11540 [Bacteroidota bacterium]|nr:hypothetical protein [Bacteroidota bacterium]
MKIKKLSLTFFLLTFISTAVFSQINNDDFKPSGKAFAKIFSNFHSSFSDKENFNTFEITRSYFGYSYQMSKNISAKVTLDVGNPASGKYEQIAFLKNALINYDDDKFSVNFGLIGMSQFKIQEKAFGYRYIYKSFQDAYKFGPSADLGLNVKYKIHKFISVDATISNGEGYKEVQADSTFKVALGLSLYPFKGLTLRGYYDYLKNDEAQSTLAIFLGYKNKNVSFGAEYNIQENNKMIENQDFSGYSAFSTYKINDKIKIFGRYDKLESVKIGNATDSWNIMKDGQYIIAGLEYAPLKGVKISPNYQGFIPDKSGESNISSIYMNLEVKF